MVLDIQTGHGLFVGAFVCAMVSALRGDARRRRLLPSPCNTTLFTKNLKFTHV